MFRRSLHSPLGHRTVLFVTAAAATLALTACQALAKLTPSGKPRVLAREYRLVDSH